MMNAMHAALQVVVGSTTHANSLAMKTEDLFPAMVLQRAPDPGVLHFAALRLISFEVRTLDMPEGIICQVRHRCSTTTVPHSSHLNSCLLGVCMRHGMLCQSHVLSLANACRASCCLGAAAQLWWRCCQSCWDSSMMLRLCATGLSPT